MPVIAEPTLEADPDRIPLALLEPWLTVVADAAGREHGVVSDGFHHVRFDVEDGTLMPGPVKLHYLIEGLHAAQPKLLSIRRLIQICLTRRFARALFPVDRRLDRWLVMLRVHDALQSGASQREIGELLFGAARIRAEWAGPSEAWKSRVRRLVYEAQRLAGGGYRNLLQPRPKESRPAPDP